MKLLIAVLMAIGVGLIALSICLVAKAPDFMAGSYVTGAALITYYNVFLPNQKNDAH